MHNMDRRLTVAPSQDKNFSGDHENADGLLDDIQSILEKRLVTARKRTSTINFNQLITNRGGGIRVNKPKTADTDLVSSSQSTHYKVQSN